jgi:hypothetical protein
MSECPPCEDSSFVAVHVAFDGTKRFIPVFTGACSMLLSFHSFIYYTRQVRKYGSLFYCHRITLDFYKLLKIKIKINLDKRNNIEGDYVEK